MILDSVRVYRFRNLADGIIRLNAPEVFLVGTNGEGKTNLLEAVYLLSYGSSFRTRKDRELVRGGKGEASLSGEFFEELTGEDGKQIPDTASIPRNVKVILSAGERERKKKIEVDGSSLTDRRSLLEQTPCIVFSHEDIETVQGPPEARRNFFDQTISLVDLDYLDLLRRYRKILRSRNHLLREKEGRGIELYDEQLISAGRELVDRRTRTVEDFNKTLGPLFTEISNLDEPVRVEYRPSWRETESLEKAAAALEEARERDIVMKTTTTGPHRDRYSLRLGSNAFLPRASTGQIRLMSLVIKTAQARFVTKKRDRLPILLLDDVLLELDRGRREAFLERIPAYQQAIFTFLPGEPYERYRKESTRVYRVEAGSFTEEETTVEGKKHA
ncbi:MAG: DNA replication and repair protein RecF [Spirochaetales bacterium]|nr:DNA replication and repair protein RecF [Spirochaetales bacterium]MCF7939867.1 DNA replication and repair protein RecF [Spirochaetales bacterium]